MKFDELLDAIGDAPLFSSTLLRAGTVDTVDLASQLSRWVASGRLISLRRGVYALAPRYAVRSPHSFEIANLLRRPSYVSAESALSFHGMLPEAVYSVTSVTVSRTERVETPLGAFAYRHIKQGLFWGYREEPVGDGRPTALVALPEKALLDLVHLRPGADRPEFVRQLRLERLEKLDLGRLLEFAQRSGSPKLVRAAEVVVDIAETQAGEWSDL